MRKKKNRGGEGGMGWGRGVRWRERDGEID